MEFDFVIHGLGGETVSKWDAEALKRLGPQEYDYLRIVLEQFGKRSATAQKLASPITDIYRLRGSDQRLYLVASRQHGKTILLGGLKVGTKRLFIRTETGALMEVEPTCVLDFYVHETCQRQGIGKQLFEHFLSVEQKDPGHVAYDRPSPKLMAFLQKHYMLYEHVPQSNNFVVFNRFFQAYPPPPGSPNGRSGPWLPVSNRPLSGPKNKSHQVFATQPLPAGQVAPLLTPEPRNAFTTVPVYNDQASPTGRHDLHRAPSFGNRWSSSNFSPQPQSLQHPVPLNGGPSGPTSPSAHQQQPYAPRVVPLNGPGSPGYGRPPSGAPGGQPQYAGGGGSSASHYGPSGQLTGLASGSASGMHTPGGSGGAMPLHGGYEGMGNMGMAGPSAAGGDSLDQFRQEAKAAGSFSGSGHATPSGYATPGAGYGGPNGSGGYPSSPHGMPPPGPQQQAPWGSGSAMAPSSMQGAPGQGPGSSYGPQQQQGPAIVNAVPSRPGPQQYQLQTPWGMDPSRQQPLPVQPYAALPMQVGYRTTNAIYGSPSPGGIHQNMAALHIVEDVPGSRPHNPSLRPLGNNQARVAAAQNRSGSGVANCLVW